MPETGSRKYTLVFFLLLQLELDIHRPVHLFRNLVDVSEGDVVFLEPEMQSQPGQSQLLGEIRLGNTGLIDGQPQEVQPAVKFAYLAEDIQCLVDAEFSALDRNIGNLIVHIEVISVMVGNHLHL